MGPAPSAKHNLLMWVRSSKVCALTENFEGGGYNSMRETRFSLLALLFILSSCNGAPFGHVKEDDTDINRAIPIKPTWN